MTKQFFKLELLIFSLSETEHNIRIEKIAQMIISDHVSIDEQDQLKLKKYYTLFFYITNAINGKFD